MVNTLKGKIRDSVLMTLRNKIDDMGLSDSDSEALEGSSKMMMGLNMLKKKLAKA